MASCCSSFDVQQLSALLEGGACVCSALQLLEICLPWSPTGMRATRARLPMPPEPAYSCVPPVPFACCSATLAGAPRAIARLRCRRAPWFYERQAWCCRALCLLGPLFSPALRPLLCAATAGSGSRTVGSSGCWPSESPIGRKCRGAGRTCRQTAGATSTCQGGVQRAQRKPPPLGKLYEEEFWLPINALGRLPASVLKWRHAVQMPRAARVRQARP